MGILGDRIGRRRLLMMSAAVFGVAIPGSVGAYVYRRELSGAAPDGVPPEAWAAARETLGGAVEMSRTLPATAAEALVTLARAAVTDELRAAAIVSTGTLLVTALLAAVLLRGVCRCPGRAQLAGRAIHGLKAPARSTLPRARPRYAGACCRTSTRWSRRHGNIPLQTSRCGGTRSADP